MAWSWHAWAPKSAPTSMNQPARPSAKALAASTYSSCGTPVASHFVTDETSKSPGLGDEPVSAAACRKSGGLVPLGTGSAGARRRGKQAHLVEHRLRRVPLVSRHGARVVRKRGD